MLGWSFWLPEEILASLPTVYTRPANCYTNPSKLWKAMYCRGVLARILPIETGWTSGATAWTCSRNRRGEGPCSHFVWRKFQSLCREKCVPMLCSCTANLMFCWIDGCIDGFWSTGYVLPKYCIRSAVHASWMSSLDGPRTVGAAIEWNQSFRPLMQNFTISRREGSTEEMTRLHWLKESYDCISWRRSRKYKAEKLTDLLNQST